MLEELKNNIDFFIRNSTRFSRKKFVEKNPRLIERNRLENLYTKDILSKCFTKKYIENPICILDIGSKNWFYAKGEYDFFKEISSNIKLDGVELDAYRLYSNFYSREEVAKYYIKGINANYISGNLLDISEKYDYIVWILPFVLPEPHSYWGLPKKYFYPEKLLAHAYSLLKTSGEMLIINQGAEEANAQKQLLEMQKINYCELGEIKSKYFDYKYTRYGFLIKK